MQVKKRSCYKCTKRYVGCQTECPDFAKDDAENEKRKSKQRQDTAIRGVFAAKYVDSKDIYAKTSHKRLKLNSFR